MSAFLPTPRAPALNVPGARAARICSRRPTPSRQPARVHFSATTDEAPPINGPPAPPPPRREERNAPPPRPSPYSSRPERPRPYADRRGFRDDRGPPRPPFVADPNVTYYTRCGSCQAAYDIKPDMLGDRGKKVGCAVCGNAWFQKADRLMALKDGENFKVYPMEEKDRLMEEAQSRRDRYRGNTGDRRDGPREPREGQGARRAPRAAYAQHSIFIGNLPFSITKEELESIISETVVVTRVAIVKDPTGRSKGFAFADLKSADDVQTAVNQLDGRDMGGRAMTVRVGRKN